MIASFPGQLTKLAVSVVPLLVELPAHSVCLLPLPLGTVARWGVETGSGKPAALLLRCEPLLARVLARRGPRGLTVAACWLLLVRHLL